MKEKRKSITNIQSSETEERNNKSFVEALGAK